MSLQPVAIITDAGGAIVRTTASALTDRGCRLPLAGRRSERLQQTPQSISVLAEDVICRTTRIMNETAVDQLFNDTAILFGRITLLFTNARLEPVAASGKTAPTAIGLQAEAPRAEFNEPKQTSGNAGLWPKGCCPQGFDTLNTLRAGHAALTTSIAAQIARRPRWHQAHVREAICSMDRLPLLANVSM